MIDKGLIEMIGKGRGAYYKLRTINMIDSMKLIWFGASNSQM
ncbi:MAG: hypothetical protein U9N61_09050 [Euryarchaeota archaeon]|nr:hypothetical protein [Euryarchaeota archaeon]